MNISDEACAFAMPVGCNLKFILNKLEPGHAHRHFGHGKMITQKCKM